MFFAGWRRNEVLELRVGDIAGRKLWERTGKRQLAPLPAGIVAGLQKFRLVAGRDPGDWVFCRVRGCRNAVTCVVGAGSFLCCRTGCRASAYVAFNIH